MRFWIPWSIDALVAGIAVTFFFIGLGDHTVSSFNIVLWLGILAVLAVVVGGSLVLKGLGQHALAFVLTLLLAVPATAFGMFFLVIVLSHPRWN
ncbi:MAG TPA: hypothetical protein VMT19_08090 [Thermoanaerobaculaceae bacterium]|nr:hypothetical protein [Thermoanaerobaculaceae bacterium]